VRDCISGERRLPACSVRQLAEHIQHRKDAKPFSIFAASCRKLQAGSLCSPDIIRNSRFIDPTNKRGEDCRSCFADGRIVGSKSEIQTVHNSVSSGKQLGLKLALISERAEQL
jgi:hypothetical protein